MISTLVAYGMLTGSTDTSQKQDHNEMTAEDKSCLLKFHEFYAQEARHQRSMMWETARWFVVILGIIFGLAFKYLLDPPINSSPSDSGILLVPTALGFIIALVCVVMTRSFYKTNLIYVSMFAKIEEELDIDRRARRESFRNDPFITWHRYNSDRRVAATSEDFVKKGISYLGFGMYTFMSFVFLSFASAFVLLSIWILRKASCLTSLTIVATAVVIVASMVLLYAGIKRVSK